jgi:hypothetical protein
MAHTQKWRRIDLTHNRNYCREGIGCQRAIACPHEAPSPISLSCAAVSSLNRFSTSSSPKTVAILFLALSSCSWSMCQRGVSGSCAMTANSMMGYICMAMMGTLQVHLLSFPRLCVRITLSMKCHVKAEDVGLEFLCEGTPRASSSCVSED